MIFEIDKNFTMPQKQYNNNNNNYKFCHKQQREKIIKDIKVKCLLNKSNVY